MLEKKENYSANPDDISQSVISHVSHIDIIFLSIKITFKKWSIKKYPGAGEMAK